jgi:hypothetical protein
LDGHFRRLDWLLVRGEIEEEMRILKRTEDTKKHYEVSEKSMVAGRACTPKYVSPE